MSSRTLMRSIDGFDRVFAFRIELRRRFDFDDMAIDARANETLAAQLFDHLRVLALAIVDQRREQ